MLAEVPKSRAKIFKEWEQSDSWGGAGNYSGEVCWQQLLIKSGKLERRITDMKE